MRPSGRWSAGLVGTGRSRWSALSVLTRTAASAGSLPAAIRARASSRAEGVEPELGDPERVRVLEGCFAGGGVGQRGDERRRLARRAAQHGVDEAGTAARGLLGELDRVADRGVGRDAVEEYELEHAEPERGADRGLEPFDRPAGELRDHVVERGAALDRAVRKPRCKGAIARVEPVAPRLAVERPVGVGAVLEYAADDRVRTRARGRDLRSLVRGALRGARSRCAALAGSWRARDGHPVQAAEGRLGRPLAASYYRISAFRVFALCADFQVFLIRRTFVHFGVETLKDDGAGAKAPLRTCR